MSTKMAPTSVPKAGDNRSAGWRASGNVLHRLFENQADTRPHALAVICGGGELTYGGLGTRAHPPPRPPRRRGGRRGPRLAPPLSTSVAASLSFLAIPPARAAHR